MSQPQELTKTQFRVMKGFIALIASVLVLSIIGLLATIVMLLGAPVSGAISMSLAVWIVTTVFFSYIIGSVPASKANVRITNAD